MGETYAALEAAWQVEHAPTADLRRTMRAIARDEARHAALSWAVASFLESRLDRAALARLNVCREDAIQSLRSAAVPDRISRAVGIPSGAIREALISELERSVWAG